MENERPPGAFIAPCFSVVPTMALRTLFAAAAVQRDAGVAIECMVIVKEY
jgi:hypothetical protein